MRRLVRRASYVNALSLLSRRDRTVRRTTELTEEESSHCKPARPVTAVGPSSLSISVIFQLGWRILRALLQSNERTSAGRPPLTTSRRRNFRRVLTPAKARPIGECNRSGEGAGRQQHGIQERVWSLAGRGYDRCACPDSRVELTLSRCWNSTAHSSILA